MHDGSSREIDRGNFRARIPNAIHPAIDSPNHVREREINGEHPEGDKDGHGRVTHPLRDRANDQRWGNDREHQLIHRENILRNPIGIITVRSRIDATKKGELKSAEKGRAVGKHEGVTDRTPENRGEYRDAKTLGQDRIDILLLNEYTISEC